MILYFSEASPPPPPLLQQFSDSTTKSTEFSYKELAAFVRPSPTHCKANEFSLKGQEIGLERTLSSPSAFLPTDLSLGTLQGLLGVCMGEIILHFLYCARWTT